MDGCVLLTSTPSCVVSPRGDPSDCALGIARRGETTHSGVDVNNTHPSMISPLNYTPHTLLLAPKFFYIYINLCVCVCVQEVWMVLSTLQYIPRNMHTVFALLCFVVVIHWLIFPYPSGLLHWHCGNLTIAPVPAKQPWWISINTSCEFIMNDCITTTKQSTTKPCAYFLGYTVVYFEQDYRLACPHHMNKDQSVYAPSLNFKYEQICKLEWGMRMQTDNKECS